MSRRSGHYSYVPTSDVPDTVRWDIDPATAGGIVTVEYADVPRRAELATRGAKYQRVTDQSYPVGDTARVALFEIAVQS